MDDEARSIFDETGLFIPGGKKALLSEAADMLAELITGWVDAQVQNMSSGMPRKMRSLDSFLSIRIDELRSTNDENINRVMEATSNYKKVIDSIEYDGEDNNIAMSILQQKIAAADSQILRLRIREKIINNCMDIASHYSSKDLQEAMHTFKIVFQGGNTFSSTTSGFSTFQGA